jgi:hypothetical protein
MSECKSKLGNYPYILPIFARKYDMKHQKLILATTKFGDRHPKPTYFGTVSIPISERPKIPRDV